VADANRDPAVDPVLCDPYSEPDRHWALDDRGQARRDAPPQDGRRDPLRITVPQDQKSAGQLKLALNDRRVNTSVTDIRQKVGEWRADGYPKVTATTRRLLQHWADAEAMRLRPFFAQREAVETFIWLREVANRGTPERRELEAAARAHNDRIVRFCAKMATGTGKTAVMAMVIAWQTLNAPHSRRARNVFHTDRFVVFAPGHTVRRRLAVLVPSEPGNVYDEMGLVPADLRRRLNRARVRVVNFQAFTQRDLIDDANARKLLGRERGSDIESWPASVRRVLGDLLGGGVGSAGGGPGICVINDEAHHCYIPKERAKADMQQEAEDRRASVWFNAIRALRDMGALGHDDTHYGQAHPVLDFSATPLWIDTASRSEPEQFEWVASDFGLMDAIESGLVKVPRVPIDDDTSRDETVWRRLYHHTSPKRLKDWITDAHSTGLPAELGGAVNAMFNDWRRKFEAWQPPTASGDDVARGTDSTPRSATTAPETPPPEQTFVPARCQPTPPVLIFVVNTIANAKALFSHVAGGEDDDGRPRQGAFEELSNVDPLGRWYDSPRTLVVHSKVAEDDAVPDELKRLLLRRAGVESKKDAEAAVREMLATVGRVDEPGADVRCVISVAMLTEGWDARTVTNIVGFRAFGTQLLCEQVTGRALRRTSYDALRPPDEQGRRLFEAEYADVVGIPFEFMPAMDAKPEAPQPPKPRTRVHTVPGRAGLRVSWPHVEQYLRVAPQGRFALRADRVAPWDPPAGGTATMAALGGVAGRESVISALDPDTRRRQAAMGLAADLTKRVTTQQAGGGAAPGPEGTASAPLGAAAGEAAGSEAGFAARGRLALFRSALAAVRVWTAHPDVNLGDDALNELLNDPARRGAAVEAVLKSCEIATGPMTRRAKLTPHQPVSDTDGVDFETTLEHVHDSARSELSHAACHSQLELLTARALDAHPQVARWARNFGLGWTLPYHHEGAWRRYEPDFVAVLAAPDGGVVNLIVECKGLMDAKAEAAAHWTTEHWIPCVAATADLAEGLHRWHYGFITDHHSVSHDLDSLIAAAVAAHAEPEAA
jgi:type III restriction enzyme